ncbi:hypothetical protein, partial [Clostridium sp. OM05-9BH]|uniref:hypothetical protein n=1 Tax=Clostridium sp. OM05-9BH TaxID=2293046 RepID=UPI001A9AADA2
NFQGCFTIQLSSFYYVLPLSVAVRSVMRQRMIYYHFDSNLSTTFFNFFRLFLTGQQKSLQDPVFMGFGGNPVFLQFKEL